MAKKEQSSQDKKKRQESRRKHEQTHKFITVRCTIDDHKKIQANANNVGKELRTYVRQVALNPKFKIVPPQPKINLETKAQIQKIGVNVNQIARAMNNQYESKSVMGIEHQLKAVAESLREIYNKIGQ